MVNHTDGHRIYAIGDIHGCLDELMRVQNNIRQDLQNRPHPHPITIYLGDFIDRGPDSRGVIDNLIAEDASAHHTHMMFGNHDEMLLTYLKDPSIPIRPTAQSLTKSTGYTSLAAVLRPCVHMVLTVPVRITRSLRMKNSSPPYLMNIFSFLRA